MPGEHTPPTAGDISGPGRFLWWLVRSQPGRIAVAMALSSAWMVSLAVPPYVLSRAVDDGLAPRDMGALVGWAAVLLGVGLLSAVLAVHRHRTMTRVRMDASFRVVRATVRQCARLGATLPRRVGAGEVVAIGIADVTVVAQSLTVAGPGFGAVVAYAAIAVVMFGISPLLALVVLGGVPLLALFIGPLLRRIERTGAGYRELQGQLTGRLVDVLGGLRVLNGLGGKQSHADRYDERSRRLTESGYRVGGPASWVGALANGLPALFLAVVVWLAARMAARGVISIGDLVAVYGYVAVLVVPVAFFIEGSGDLARAVVAARRVIRLLALEPDHRDTPGAVEPPGGCGPLVDPASGVVLRAGRMTALVSARPAEAVAVVERLGRFTDTDATWSGTRIDALAPDRLRERLLVADNDADFFAGTIREAVAGRCEPDDARVRAAVRAAVADDVVDALPAGLDAEVTPGAGTLSGGQRQRLRLARAVYAEPDVLLAVEPTSAVDAHTEAVMATRLRAARHGRTTLVTTTSPLVLAQADEVVFLTDGHATATGTHDELMREHPAYRDLVTRQAGLLEDGDA
ncbi:ABC transporter transmembrane domain-containing protein [Actinokineospora spheciospongiae]|uniref:ABC transporter transmembrane domain-containing protein n=1 Tax=Actinokineospora spheciospongiae TaxID=909613 RepID=UPI000D7168F3|nr:ABC transporter ATP-binding protein [Actinokineospora spheciospongiae]PWW66762.1 ABC-type multidrug transport system fused ATPase/permease subunit [Actinokineospora spheciospongiae]